MCILGRNCCAYTVLREVMPLPIQQLSCSHAFCFMAAYPAWWVPICTLFYLVSSMGTRICSILTELLAKTTFSGQVSSLEDFVGFLDNCYCPFFCHSRPHQTWVPAVINVFQQTHSSTEGCLCQVRHQSRTEHRAQYWGS